MAEPTPHPPSRAQVPGRYRRVLGALGATLGLSFVFVTSLVGAVLLHLDLGPTRRTVRQVVNLAMAESFQGRLDIGEIDRLNLHGLSVRSATAYDPKGAQVIDARGIHADADVMGIVKSALFGTGDLRIAISKVRLDHADVALEPGAEGAPTIAELFLPRHPGPPPPPGGRKPRVTLERIEIGHIWAHGGIVQPAGVDAELTDGVGHFEVSPDGITVDVQPTHLDARAPLPRPLAATAVFKLQGDASGSRMIAGVDGQIGDLVMHTDAKLQGSHLVAHVEIPHATAETVSTLIPVTPPPTIPLRVPVSAVIDAEGDLPDIDFKTRFTLEKGGAVAVDGKIGLRSTFTLDAGLTVTGLDPLALLDLGSAEPLSAVGHVHMDAGKEVKIEAEATTEPFALAGNPIPRVNAKATFADGLWRATATVEEPGAPVHAAVTFDPAAKNLGFDVEGTVPSLRGIARVKVPVDGSASAHVKGSLRDGTLDAAVSARAAGIRAADGAVTLERAAVDARVKGKLDALEVDATVAGSGVQAGSYAWQDVTAHVRGPLLAPKIDAELRTGESELVKVQGSVDAKAQTIRGVELDVKRREGQVGGNVAKVAVTPRGIEVEGISLHGGGIGALTGGLVVGGKEITGKLRGENVDLEKVAHLASYPGHVAGLANVDVDLASSGPGSRKGHVSLEIADGETALVHGVSGLFTATFDGDRVRADALLRVVAHAGEHEPALDRCDGAIAQIRITDGQGKLPGPLLDARSWEGVSGQVEVAADEWRLRCIRRLIPSFLPVPELHGKLTTRITVERAPGARLPTVKSLFARTKGLVVKTDEWRSEHTDVELKASLDGQSGDTEATVTVLDHDPLASVTVGARLDLLTLLERPDERWASIKKAALHGKVKVEKRAVTAFAGLPTFITDRVPLLTGQDGQTLAGEIEVDAALSNTITAPKLEGHVKIFQVAQVVLPPKTKDGEQGAVQGPVLGPWGLPVDATLDTTYDGQKVKVDLHAENNAHAMLRAAGELAMPIADLLDGRALKPKASLHATLDKVPIGEVPFFQDRGVGGNLSGKIDVDGLGERPKITVKLDLPHLTVGRVNFEETDLSLDVDEPQKAKDGERSTAKVQLTLKGGNAGSITTSAAQQLSWRDGLVPVLDPKSPAQIDLRAAQFRLAVAEPFLDNIVSSLDGLLDGTAHLSFKPAGDGGVATKLGDVALSLTKGVVNLPQLGQELHGLMFKITHDESGRIVLKDLRAQGTRGLLTGAGSADFAGLVPTRADVTLNIAAGDELPISYQGAPVGDLRGTVKVNLKVTPDEAKHRLDAKVTVALDPLHLDLSPALSRSLSVAGDGDNPDIHIRQSKPVDEAQPAVGNTSVDISFSPVNVSLKGKLAGRVPLEGTLVGSRAKPLHVQIGGKKPKISGVLTLPRFTLNVFHKEFVIEHGTITFDPDDVEKSFVNLSARYAGADGEYYLDVLGNLGQFTPDKLDKSVKCRSTVVPADRCLAALALGSDQGSVGGGGQAQQGQALAASALASQFSTEIAGGLSTNIGTGDDGSLQPGVTLKKDWGTIDLSTYGAGATGGGSTAAAGGAAPKGQHTLLSVDWRFWRNWALHGKIDIGSDTQSYGADILWQYRY